MVPGWSQVVMDIKYFEEEKAWKHWGDYKLKGYIYNNVHPSSFFESIKKLVLSTYNNSSTNTFLTHNTIFTTENRDMHIVHHSQNNREQNVVYDLSFFKEWWCQTPDTIKSWSDNKIKHIANLAFYKHVNTFLNAEPFASESHKFIPYRVHLNVLTNGKNLGPHIDGSILNYKVKHIWDARMFSLTFYLYDHVENCGGELFSINGFSYKPKANSAILINGNQVGHGVTANIDPSEKIRLAFTTRFVHIDDLYLPGSPDKHLYNINPGLM